MRGTLTAMLLVVVAAGSAACGSDRGSPTVPTTPGGPGVGTQAAEQAARQSVEAWLALLDAGNYSDAYNATASESRRWRSLASGRSSASTSITVLWWTDSTARWQRRGRRSDCALTDGPRRPLRRAREQDALKK